MLLNTYQHHFPLTRPNGLCAVRDCPNRANTVRVTNAGWPVNYCPEHERNAARSFDQDWKHGPRRS